MDNVAIHRAVKAFLILTKCVLNKRLSATTLTGAVINTVGQYECFVSNIHDFLHYELLKGRKKERIMGA